MAAGFARVADLQHGHKKFAGKRSEVLHTRCRIPWRVYRKRSGVARLGASGISRCSWGAAPGFINHCIQRVCDLGRLFTASETSFWVLPESLGTKSYLEPVSGTSEMVSSSILGYRDERVRRPHIYRAMTNGASASAP